MRLDARDLDILWVLRARNLTISFHVMCRWVGVGYGAVNVGASH